MSDTLIVKIPDCHGDLSSIKFDDVLWESFLILEDFVELTTSDKRHNKVEAELGLEQVVHAN
jgi:hypothetical protein